MAKCPDCYGSSDLIGLYGDGKCDECYGTGEDQNFITQIGSSVLGADPCWKCEGTGTCQTCDGDGEI
jgi:hypothetical protein